MAVNVYDVSNCFINLAQQEKNSLTKLQMQKLLYYAQGFNLALYDKPIFDDDIQAWSYGPVVLKIHFAYKKFNSEPLTILDGLESNCLSPGTIKLIRSVLHQYGSYDGWDLVHMTHNEAPWANAYQPGINAIIPLDSLKDYFRGRIGVVRKLPIEYHLEESFRQYGELYDLLA